MKNGRAQAKDIPDRPVLEFLTRIPPYDCGMKRTWACSFAGFPAYVGNGMPEGTPHKVVMAKMASLKRRGLCTGCLCGCRGDFEITPRGRQFLSSPS